VVSYCHTTFGRANKMSSPIQMMRMLKENSITVGAAERQGEAMDGTKIIRGVLRDEEKPEFTELYDQMIKEADGTPPPRKRLVRKGWT
jgi:2-oxoglutarate/2-oxoacid ferredoxin oxidoreductase subunit beta